METMPQPLSHTCGTDSLFSSRILKNKERKKNVNEAFNHLIFESQNIPYIYYDTDMMKTSTMSHASVEVTGHTGQLFQVSLGHFLTTAILQKMPQQSEL